MHCPTELLISNRREQYLRTQKRLKRYSQKGQSGAECRANILVLKTPATNCNAAKGICERDVYVASAHMPAAESLKYQKLVKKASKPPKKIYDKKRETKSVYKGPAIMSSFSLTRLQPLSLSTLIPWLVLLVTRAPEAWHHTQYVAAFPSNSHSGILEAFPFDFAPVADSGSFSRT